MAGSIPLELVANTGVLVIFLSCFAVGTLPYFRLYAVPMDATFDIQVIGKQWMWQFQHPTGQREINELHVPSHTRVRLTMTSEDVIHSLYLPAFRVKRDVIPGRYMQYWIEATDEGTFPIYCAEYCGLEHSRMIGRIVVMRPTDYQDWAQGGGSHQSPVQAGAALYERIGCAGCHGANAEGGRCPPLLGVYGTTVTFADGTSAQADDEYVRESILRPRAKIVAGYPDIMPTFQGQLTEMQLMQLVSFVRSLNPQSTAQ